MEGTDKKVFETLRTALFEFINNRQWTSYNFSIEERIECTILINVTSRLSSDEFQADLNMALKRPIHNSAYNSTTLNYIDKDFKFTYVEYQPLEFVPNTFTSNLTSVIAYYIYIFLGLDFDSFTLYGGSQFFEYAENIVNAAQSSGETGWKSFESQKNRFWLVENLSNPSYQDIRKFMYEYHRLGLFFLQLIMDAKSNEFIDVFTEGSSTEKTRAMNILKKLDPANASRYEEIMK